MKTIFKYSLEILDTEIHVNMPMDAEILSVQNQFEHPTLWVLCDTTRPNITRRFEIFGTGHDMDIKGKKYIGTCQVANGMYVWHVFEIL